MRLELLIKHMLQQKEWPSKGGQCYFKNYGGGGLTQDNNKIDTLRSINIKKIDNSNQNVEGEGEV